MNPTGGFIQWGLFGSSGSGWVEDCHSHREGTPDEALGCAGEVLRAALGVCGLVAALGGSTPETITLKDGHQVTGAVVAEKPQALYVDLGFDVVRIPRDSIVGRGKPGSAPAAGPAVRVEDADDSGFFDSRALKASPVKELVQTFGEAVISIETPSAKGSGFIVNADGFAITNCARHSGRDADRGRVVSERAERPGAAAD